MDYIVARSYRTSFPNFSSAHSENFSFLFNFFLKMAYLFVCMHMYLYMGVPVCGAHVGGPMQMEAECWHLVSSSMDELLEVMMKP